MKVRHFLSLKYFSSEELNYLVNLSMRIKKNISKYRRTLRDRYIGLIFEKPSLRTKTAFYLSAIKMGAVPVYYTPSEIKLGERENISDVARTVSRYFDAIVLRTFSHESLEEFAQYSSIPVVNALTDFLHPSQVLADILTLKEVFRKDIKSLKLAFVGDGNNVCHSLLYGISILGGRLWVASPKKYQPSPVVVDRVRKIARKTKAEIVVTNSVYEAVEGANIVYTDVWTSMGKEEERKERKKIFKKYQINSKIIKKADDNCVIMHCLPAKRGEEITDEVIDSKRSIVFLQAENRLYSAAAILIYVMNGIKLR